ncbi:hypothetical protein CYMTET_27191 [Cymbomonas tetramitiformis]|uniref:Uncharacterized protein n=1 Tax=Cymbomonas tetramitiformis TaxID=36881 RepID=A0AAE0FQ92_9CHLO|nr:hypothetical protein CYMTET_27191 [Cymbomonas tetramitiformis]
MRSAAAQNYPGCTLIRSFVEYEAFKAGTMERIRKAEMGKGDMGAPPPDFVMVAFLQPGVNDPLKARWLGAVAHLSTSSVFHKNNLAVVEDRTLMAQLRREPNTVAIEYARRYHADGVPFRSWPPAFLPTEELELAGFLRSNVLSIVPELAANLAHDWWSLTSKPAMVLVYFDVNWLKRVQRATGKKVNPTTEFRGELVALAQRHPDMLVAIASTMLEGPFSLRSVDLADVQDEYRVAIFDRASHQKFPLRDDFSMALMENFVKDFKRGASALESYMLSQPPPRPEANSPGRVYTIVGKTFEQIVNQETRKDILLTLYRHNDQDTQRRVAPQMVRLAQVLAYEERIVVAMLEATLNEYPVEFTSESLPAVFFRKAGNPPTLERYTEELDLDTMLAFLRRKSSSPAFKVLDSSKAEGKRNVRLVKRKPEQAEKQASEKKWRSRSRNKKDEL